MRLASLRAGFALLMALGACGDDDGPGNPDSPVVNADGRIDTMPGADASPDAPVVTFFSDEGGEVRFEYVRLASGNANARVIAFFKGDDDVDFHDYPNLAGCTLVTDDTRWPTTDPMNADYIDVGTLTITNGTQTITVPKATIDSDPLQRTHGAGNWYYDPVMDVDDASDFITEKTAYDVVLGGAGTFPATTFEDAIYIPADFNLVNPDDTVSPVQLEADTALDVNWQMVDSMQPSWSTPAWVIVGFVTPADGAVVVCVETMNDGNVNISSDFVNMVRTAAPTGGTMIRQVLHHNVRELEGPGVQGMRRIDMIGVWCYAYPFEVI